MRLRRFKLSRVKRNDAENGGCQRRLAPSEFKRGNNMETVALLVIGCLAVFLTMFMLQILVVLVGMFVIVILTILHNKE